MTCATPTTVPLYLVFALTPRRSTNILLYLCYVYTTWYHHVWNDDVRRKTEQPHLSATVQVRHLSLFGHVARMPDEVDAKQILTASPLDNWRRPPGRPHTTWMKTTQQDLKWTSPWTKQLIRLRIAHSGDWCPCFNVWHYALIVVHARNEWMNVRMLRIRMTWDGESWGNRQTKVFL